MRLLRFCIIALAVLVVVPGTLEAQGATPSGVQSSQAALSSAPPSITWAQLGTRQLSAWRHVGWGALSGALLLGAATYVTYTTSDEECLGCAPIIVVPIVTGAGALLGAATGYVVYLVRRANPAT